MRDVLVAVAHRKTRRHAEEGRVDLATVFELLRELEQPLPLGALLRRDRLRRQLDVRRFLFLDEAHLLDLRPAPVIDELSLRDDRRQREQPVVALG